MQEKTVQGKRTTTIGEAAIRVLVDAALKKGERWAVLFIVSRLAPETLILEGDGDTSFNALAKLLNDASRVKPDG